MRAGKRSDRVARNNRRYRSEVPGYVQICEPVLSVL